MNLARGAKIRSGVYAIGLISWAAREGSTVSSLICDRWLTRKLATFIWLNRFPGVLDSADMIDVRLRLWGWTYSEPLSGGWLGCAAAQAGRMSCCTVHLHSWGREHNLGLKSFKLLPFSLSLHTSAWWNL